MSRLARMLAIAALTTTGMVCMAESPGGQVSLRSLAEENERVKASWNADIEAGRAEDAVVNAERLAKLQRQLIDHALLERSTDFDQLDEFCDALSVTLSWLAERFEQTDNLDKILDNLGWLHQKMGDLVKSEGEYRQALAIRRGDSQKGSGRPAYRNGSQFEQLRSAETARKRSRGCRKVASRLPAYSPPSAG